MNDPIHEAPRGPKHRPLDPFEEIPDDDLEAFAASAERAADHPELDLVDLCELYHAADMAREAATENRRKRRN